MQKPELIAVIDHNDNIIAYNEKLIVHKLGLLHRAFSILVFNDQNQVLLQKRASSKYHSPNLWTNTCCSHLVKDKDFERYIHERLMFEMGFDCKLKFAFSFHYKIEFDNGLTENEIDHVYLGKWNGIPNPNPEEADEFKWVDYDFIKRDIQINPQLYTYWFVELMKRNEEISLQLLK